MNSDHTRLSLILRDRTVGVACPADIAADLVRLLPGMKPDATTDDVVVTCNADGLHGVAAADSIFDGLQRPEALQKTISSIAHALVRAEQSNVAIRAGAVTYHDATIVVGGHKGAGKTSTIAWLVEQGCAYLTDEIVFLSTGGLAATFPLVPIAEPGNAAAIAALPSFSGRRTLPLAEGALAFLASEPSQPQSDKPCRLLLLPQFESGAALHVEALTAGKAAFHLMGANLNASHLEDGGLEALGALTRNATCLSVRFGDASQFDGVLDVLMRLVIDQGVEAPAVRNFLSSLSTPTAPAIARKLFPVPEMSPPLPSRRLTVGMTTYDDFDGVYFTIQSLRLFHGEALGDAEILVIDNNPTGPCAQALKDLGQTIPNFRYIPLLTRQGTIVRDELFKHASGEYMLCMDCHVMFAPGSIQRLQDYFDANPDTRDLLQGPLIYDDLNGHLSTHFNPVWSGGMWGTWGTDDRANDLNAAPFDIMMQGVGAFACRRDAWPGYNPLFRGFGAEEGYIHEKFRQRGGRTLCLPFFRWLHRFQRPLGTPYPNEWRDRIANYVIGFREVGLPEDEMRAHFRELLAPGEADAIFASIEDELGAA